MGWLIGVALGVAAVIAVRGLIAHGPASAPYRQARRDDPGNRLDRKAAHYRASGALPPWD